MESYVIHECHVQGEKYAFVKINNLIDTPQSVRECRFQTIGWILHLYEKVNSLVNNREEIIQKDNIRIALIQLASLDEEVSLQLVRAQNWRMQFDLVWPTLTPQERKQALSYVYDGEAYVNYWPGFGTFNEILLSLSQDALDESFLFGLPGRMTKG